MAKRKIGRDAGTGRFIPVDKAKKDKDKAIVETIIIPEKRNLKNKPIIMKAHHKDYIFQYFI